MLDPLALGIGYAFMIAGGLGLAGWCCWIAKEALWRLGRSAKNAADSREAFAEWCDRHPERYARWLKRNGGSFEERIELADRLARERMARDHGEGAGDAPTGRRCSFLFVVPRVVGHGRRLQD